MLGLERVHTYNFYNRLAICSADVGSLFAHCFDGYLQGVKSVSKAKTVYIRVRGTLANRLLRVLIEKSGAGYLPITYRPLINEFDDVYGRYNTVFITDEFADLINNDMTISEDFDTANFEDALNDIKRLERLCMPYNLIISDLLAGVEKNLPYEKVTRDYRFTVLQTPTGGVGYDLEIRNDTPAHIMTEAVTQAAQQYNLVTLHTPEFVNDTDVVSVLRGVESSMS